MVAYSHDGRTPTQNSVSETSGRKKGKIFMRLDLEATNVTSMILVLYVYRGDGGGGLKVKKLSKLDDALSNQMGQGILGIMWVCPVPPIPEPGEDLHISGEGCM